MYSGLLKIHLDRQKSAQLFEFICCSLG